MESMHPNSWGITLYRFCCCKSTTIRVDKKDTTWLTLWLKAARLLLKSHSSDSLNSLQAWSMQCD